MADDTTKMTLDEMERFLAEPWIAALGTVKRDGSPHVDPVGYVFEDGIAYVSLIDRRLALRRIRREPRVFLSVFDERTPDVTGVQIAGRAEETDDPSLVRSLQILRRYAQFGEAQGRYERTWRGEGKQSFSRVLVRITPDRMFGWDHKKRPTFGGDGPVNERPMPRWPTTSNPE